VNNNLIAEVASYEGESMILLYRNSILVQYHPERTKDGLKLIDNWIRYQNYKL
jgi:imidazoleglycerol phosphate synthase glutamine amidotransferase subunit HisH